MKTQLFLIAILALALAGCSKKADDPAPVATPAPTNADLLTTGRWKLQSATFNGTAVALTGCKADDIYTYQKDGIYAIDEGGTKCNSGDPQTYTDGIWALSYSQGTIVYVHDGLKGYIETITTLTTQILVTIQTDANSNVIVATYVHA